MGKKIIINPMTRISGFLQIEVEVENKKVVEAKSQGMLFRGFEKMLKGRTPTDAVYFTERICGICSTAHAIGSTRALENAMNIKVSDNEIKIRDILHGCEFLQNHIRHFYQYTLPDYVGGFDINPLFDIGQGDFRIPKDRRNTLIDDYFLSIEYSRKAHSLLALLGGKAPHTHGIFPGGVVVNLDAQKILTAKGIMEDIRSFINNKFIDDITTVARYYNDYFKIGAANGNFMSFGLFNSYNDVKYSEAKILLKNSNVININKDKITESVENNWYTSTENQLTLENQQWEPDAKKSDSYSWIKAPRYDGLALEVGPLARMNISGIYKGESSTMNRLIARALEAKKVIEIMEELINSIEIMPNSKKNLTIPEKAIGYSLQDTTRGALAHYLSIDNKKIEKYTIITPSTWNLSPKDSNGIRGAVEEALVGTYIEDEKNPIEVGRIVRSFDPCVSCATHVVTNGMVKEEIRVV